ncbi:hypothetical protein [Rhodococcus tukisamuensis]|nr:hypothetical protein [Rhodococcus tukisamuensis]
MSNTPQPRGRRPKVAGTGKAPGRPTSPVEGMAAVPVEDTAVAPVENTAPAQVEGPAAESVAVAAAKPVATPQVPEVPESEPVENPTPAGAASSDVEVDDADGAAEAAAAGADAPDESVSAGDTDAARAGWRRVAVVGVVALVLAGFAIVAAVKPGAGVANQAWVDTAATSRVTADARHAIETLYTYKFDTVDQDFDNARAVLADNMRTEFDKTAQVTRDAVVQTKTATSAQVSDIGVKILSDENAELVGSMTVSATNDGAAQGSAQGPLSVTMTKVDGTWLLADIRDR